MAAKTTDIYDMELHQTIQVGPLTTAMRVPGGWIYCHVSWKDEQEVTTSTFVPLDYEFQQEKQLEKTYGESHD